MSIKGKGEITNFSPSPLISLIFKKTTFSVSVFVKLLIVNDLNWDSLLNLDVHSISHGRRESRPSAFVKESEKEINF
jgi:hypothetical protein